MKVIRTNENLIFCFSLVKRSHPTRYNTIQIATNSHAPTKISLFIIPHCSTLSAFARNFTAKATSTKPNTTFTSVIHPPDLGSDCNQLGKKANNANGNPNATPKPAAPTVSGHGPSFATFANSDPNIGPV